jgi:mono/diheme cytochrome c family protein
MTPSLVLMVLLGAEPYLDLRERARDVLSTHCGSCHTRGLKTAMPKALAIFELTLGDFAATMSPRQLESGKHRLASDLAEDATPRNVPKADQQLFARFVAAELARRNP